MTEKVVRGQVLVFSSTPRDAEGNIVEPGSMKLYLHYTHADGTTSTDVPIDMDGPDTAGAYRAEFDTSNTKSGPAFASIQADLPGAAYDIKFTITANNANPPNP